uniref:Uncharacterized protein n=1 Tax=Arundo donax TaxID=35708 RepID=A0A0A9F9B9_ARUDO
MARFSSCPARMELCLHFHHMHTQVTNLYLRCREQTYNLDMSRQGCSFLLYSKEKRGKLLDLTFNMEQVISLVYCLLCK